MSKLVICRAWRHGAVEKLAHIETEACVDPRSAACLWTGKDEYGGTCYCCQEPGHAPPHRDATGYEFTDAAPHPAVAGRKL